MIDIGRLGVEACATMRALDSGIGLAEILVGLRRQVLEEIMTPQTGLGQTLEATTGIRTDKLARSVLKVVWVLGGHVVLQSLPSRALVCAMLALVLEGARMLRLDVHMDGALVLLDEGAMRALKLTGLGANVFEGHGWGPVDPGGKMFNFFAAVSATESNNNPYIRFFA
jgi:hypothetical protein